MAITNPALKPFVLNNTDIQFLLDQVNFVPLFDSAGNAIFNWDGTGTVYDAYHKVLWDSTTNSGSYKGVPLTTANYQTVLGTSYQNTTDLAGLRDPSGFNNNLTLIHANWGQAGFDFPRTAPAAFGKYSDEQLNLGVQTLLSSSAAVLNHGASSFNPATDLVIDNSSTNNTYIGSTKFTKTIAEQAGTATYVDVTSQTDTTFTNGHHQLVSKTVDSTTTTTDTYTYSFDNITTSVSLNGAAPVTTVQNTSSAPTLKSSVPSGVNPVVTTTLSGGELDTTTQIMLADGKLHDAHTFEGKVSDMPGVNGTTKTITNGVTSLAVYTNPWDSVVDYTPRMISRTTTTAGVTYDTWANHQTLATPITIYSSANVIKTNWDGTGIVYTDAGALHPLPLPVSHTPGDAAAKAALAFLSANPLAASHMPNEIYYDPTTGVAVVKDWGLLETVANGGLGQLDTQARLVASAGQDDHFIGGQNPGVQGSNGFFVLFGQFFDHGLDFIDKGGQGSVIKIALAVDDPLYGMLGPDGQPVTSITINRATVHSMDANGTPEYVNHTSPFIDQSQTYGSTSQVTNLLREWVSDTTTPTAGDFHAGMKMFDGNTLATSWINGQGQTVNSTLPTLNELRAHIVATGRDNLTWEDISDLRNRDASGKVIATGQPGAGTSGSALILDSNPRFDAAHLFKSTGFNDLNHDGVQNFLDNDHDGAFNAGDVLEKSQTLVVHDAIDYLTAYVASTAFQSARPGDAFGMVGDKLTLHLATDMPIDANPTHNIPAGDYTGASSLMNWVNFSDFSIMQTVPNLPPALVTGIHDAVSEILMASVGDHYIAGDGRVNENFGLTSIHHVFHEEHNFQVQNLMEALHVQDIATNDVTHDKLHSFQVSSGMVDNTGKLIAVVGALQATGDASYSQVFDAANPAHSLGYALTTNVKAGIDATTGDYLGSDGKIAWDMDKMFNASKLIVEMEYQHAAVDQYARNVTPNIQEFVGYSPDKNPGVTLEYAQGAFRFGHSTLRETIDTIDPTHGLTGKIMGYALRDAFLNPDKYSEVGAAAIINGMTHQQMNEVDEFITPALNQGLLGQPLDLAAINIARGRDIGLPTLNDFRAAIGLLKYTSWTDFGQNMQHPQSLANFIAAYSFDGDMAKAQAILDLASGAYIVKAGAVATLAEQAANLAAGLVLADTVGYTHATSTQADLDIAVQNATKFMNGQELTNDDGALGFNHIDTWLGGLAEIHQPGGILGETFDKVFVNQIESLMDGDRFYYLYRLAGQQFAEEVGNGQLKDIVERNTGLTHLNGNIFGYSDQYIDLGAKKEISLDGTELQTTGNEHKYGDVYTTTHDAAGKVFFENTKYADGALHGNTMGVYSNGGLGNANDGHVITIKNADGLGHDISYIQDTRLADTDPNSAYNKNGGVNIDGTPNSGAESHEVIVGTDRADLIYGQGGDDTVYGDGGNDIIFGGYGIDRLYGGTGNDTIWGGDNPDLIDGGSGDDKLYGDSSGSDINGADQIIGGSGNDYIDGGIGIDKLSGGTGDDHVVGGQDTDPFTHGSDGNDIVEGNSGGDILYGDNGDDLVIGGADQDQLFGGNGDDILRPGDPTGALTIGTDEVLGGDGASDLSNDGKRLGFDVVDFSDNTHTTSGITFDLGNQLNPATVVNGTPIQLPTFQIEGIIGSDSNDTLTGSSAGDAGLTGDLAALDVGENWIVGGSGNDLLTGNGGNDIIIGGSIRLDSLIGKYQTHMDGLVDVTYENNNNNSGGTTAGLTAQQVADEVLQDARYQGASHRVLYSDQVDNSGLIDAANGPNGTQFDKHFTEMLRSAQFKDMVLGDGGATGTDTAVYSGDRSQYTYEFINFTGSSGDHHNAIKITDTVAGRDGTDILVDIAKLQFATGAAVNVANLFNAAPVISPAIAVNFVGLENTTNAVTPSQNGQSLAGSTIAQLAATDMLTADQIALGGVATPLTWSLASDFGGLFAIDNTGKLTFATAPNFEALAALGTATTPTQLTYSVVVNVTDGDLTTAQTETITINNVDEKRSDGVANAVDISATNYTINLNGGGNPNGVVLNATDNFVDPDGVLSRSYQWQTTVDSGANWTNIANATNAAFTGALGAELRVQETYTDPFGVKGPFTSTETVFVGTNGNNTLAGTAGNDLLLGLNGNNDIAVFNGTAWTSNAALRANGGAGPTPVFTVHTATGGTDTLQSIETLRFANGDYTLNTTGAATVTTLGGNDYIVAGTGAHTINSGGGEDVIVWSATDGIGGNPEVVDGLYTVNGGAPALSASARGDTFVINGDSSVETFDVYGANIAGTASTYTGTVTGGAQASHIYITRTVGTTTSLIADLRNIEELQFNMGGAIATSGTTTTIGTDKVITHGNYAPSALAYNTITVDDQGLGAVTVDVTDQTSAHHIALYSTNTNDQIIGARAQDQIITNTAPTTGTGGTGSGGTGGTDTSGSGTGTGGTDTSGSGTGETEVHHTHSDDGMGPGQHGTPPSGGTGGTPPASTAPVAPVDQTLQGDANANILAGGDGNNTISGLAGDDLISSGNGNNNVIAGDGADTIVLGNGNNHVDAGLGADSVFLGNGTNWVNAGAGDDTVFGGTGNTTFVDSGNDGNDTYHGGGASDTLDMSAISARIEANLGTGYAGWAKVGTETNHLYGIENIATGSGDDTVTASDAHNTIDVGDHGAGHDTVIFRTAASADGDNILNFQTGDKIDLHGMMNGTINLVSTAASAHDIAVQFDATTHGDSIVTGIDEGGNHFSFDVKGHHVVGTDFAA